MSTLTSSLHCSCRSLSRNNRSNNGVNIEEYHGNCHNQPHNEALIYAAHSLITAHTPHNHSSTHSLITTYQLTEEKRRLQYRNPYHCCRWWSTVDFPLWYKQATFDHTFYPTWKTDHSRTTVFLGVQRSGRRKIRFSHVGSKKNSISLRNDVRWNGLSGWCYTRYCLVFWDQKHWIFKTNFNSFDRVMFNIY